MIIMSAYDDNPACTGSYVWITADDTAGRRSRASQVNAAKRAYERDHGVTLELLAKSYSETPGFLHRSSFRYRITRPVSTPTAEPAWTWPAGKTFVELSPADKAIATRIAGARLSAELTAMAPAIAKILEEETGG